MARRSEYYLRETVAGLKRNGLVAFAAVSTVFIAAFLFGGAQMLSRQIDRIVELETDKVEIAVFLLDNISQAQSQRIETQLREMPEVASVRYESKQEAFRRYKELYAGEQDKTLVSNVTADALPASYRVKLHDPEKFEVVSARLQGEPGIERIRDNRELLKQLFGVTHLLTQGAYIASVIMLLSAVALIANTVRMAVFARRKEIGIMRLVGATSWFIRVPFMIEAVVEGLLGSVLAIAVLAILKGSFFNDIHSLLGFWPVLTTQDFLVLVPFLLGGGVLVATLASWLAMRRFLEV